MPCGRLDLRVSPRYVRASILPSLADGLASDAAKTQVERIAREVLTNPVIEDFTYRLEE